jgi:hypothetical protein
MLTVTVLIVLVPMPGQATTRPPPSGTYYNIDTGHNMLYDNVTGTLTDLGDGSGTLSYTGGATCSQSDWSPTFWNHGPAIMQCGNCDYVPTELGWESNLSAYNSDGRCASIDALAQGLPKGNIVARVDARLIADTMAVGETWSWQVDALYYRGYFNGGLDYLGGEQIAGDDCTVTDAGLKHIIYCTTKHDQIPGPARYYNLVPRMFDLIQANEYCVRSAVVTNRAGSIDDGGQFHPFSQYAKGCSSIV